MNIMGTSSPGGWLKVLEHIPCNVGGGEPWIPRHCREYPLSTTHEEGMVTLVQGPRGRKEQESDSLGWKDPGLDLAGNKIRGSNPHSPVEPRASSPDWG